MPLLPGGRTAPVPLWRRRWTARRGLPLQGSLYTLSTHGATATTGAPVRKHMRRTSLPADGKHDTKSDTGLAMERLHRGRPPPRLHRFSARPARSCATKRHASRPRHMPNGWALSDSCMLDVLPNATKWHLRRHPNVVRPPLPTRLPPIWSFDMCTAARRKGSHAAMPRPYDARGRPLRPAGSTCFMFCACSLRLQRRPAASCTLLGSDHRRGPERRRRLQAQPPAARSRAHPPPHAPSLASSTSTVAAQTPTCALKASACGSRMVSARPPLQCRLAASRTTHRHPRLTPPPARALTWAQRPAAWGLGKVSRAPSLGNGPTVALPIVARCRRRRRTPSASPAGLFAATRLVLGTSRGPTL